MLKRYIDEDPEDSFSRYALSLEYIRLNDFPEAKRILSELMFKDPDYLALSNGKAERKHRFYR